MRMSRSSLVGSVILALLGGLGGPVLAQDAEGQTIAVTPVRGEAVETRTVVGGVPTPTDWGVQFNDATYEHDIQWSDPRLPSLMRIHENLNAYSLTDELGVYSWASSIRLEGDEGAWSGTEYGMGQDSAEGLVLQPRMMLLTGEGAYDGLSAVLQRQAEVVSGESSPVFEGYVFGGGLPTMPEPLEPLTE